MSPLRPTTHPEGSAATTQAGKGVARLPAKRVAMALDAGTDEVGAPLTLPRTSLRPSGRSSRASLSSNEQQFKRTAAWNHCALNYCTNKCTTPTCKKSVLSSTGRAGSSPTLLSHTCHLTKKQRRYHTCTIKYADSSSGR